MGEELLTESLALVNNKSLHTRLVMQGFVFASLTVLSASKEGWLATATSEIVNQLHSLDGIRPVQMTWLSLDHCAAELW